MRKSPIPAADGVISVTFVEFASIPDSGAAAPAWLNKLNGVIRLLVA